MENRNIPITIKLPFPVDKPNANGTIYSRDAVINAIYNFPIGTPIICYDNKIPTPIGVIDENTAIITEDNEQGIINCVVKGHLFAGGTQEAQITINK